MIVPFADLLERYFQWPTERTIPILTRIVVLLATGGFLTLATLIVAFESLFPDQLDLAGLQEGDVATRDIYAPETRTYVSHVLTERLRQAARDSEPPVFNPADLAIARVQSGLAVRILDFIDNVRRDIYASPEQRLSDLKQITALQLTDDVLNQIVQAGDEPWNAIKSETSRLLEQVMQDSIRDTDIPAILDRLPNQVDLRFSDDRDIKVVVEIVQDLIRPNRTINADATEAAKQAAAQVVPQQEIIVQRGQLIVSSGAVLEADDLEALQELGLMQPLERRWQEIARALVAVVVVIVITGLYLARFRPKLLYREPRFLALLATIFLLILMGVRLSLSGEIYLYPSALLALLYVALVNQQVAIIGVLGLAFLTGLMTNNSLEIATLVAAGGMIGVLSLRRPERVNNYFVAGLMVSIINVSVAVIFNVSEPTTLMQNIPPLLAFGLMNGILAAAAAIVGLYLIGQILNLPTALKLIELSQPNQPLLQRLLREAPGTYQHSLQVANLSEQAANAIGANAALIYVAALYHDIGKILNPAFFTENQRDVSSNLHDTLNDPYRSADIIISHVTEGDALARQHRLPNRLRDFIREHHGTSEVFVFYQQALARAEADEDAVDVADFRYPGPRPQSRETAIMMLADSAEATIRSTQPGTRQEIEDTVDKIIEGKRRSGQLDDSGLTLNDLNTIKRIFVDLLKAMFHPRINYAEAVTKTRGGTGTGISPIAAAPGGDRPPAPEIATSSIVAATSGTPASSGRESYEGQRVETPKIETGATGVTGTGITATGITAAASKSSPTATDETASRRPETQSRSRAMTQDLPRMADDDDDSPMPDVPPLPRANNGGKTRQTIEATTETVKELPQVNLPENENGGGKNDGDEKISGQSTSAPEPREQDTPQQNS